MLCLCRSANASDISISISVKWSPSSAILSVVAESMYRGILLILRLRMLWCSHLLLDFAYACAYALVKTSLNRGKRSCFLINIPSAPSARIYEQMRAQKNPPTRKNEAYELVICCNAFENNEARWYSPRREPKPLNEQEMKFVSTLTSWSRVSSIYAHDNDKISDHPSQKITVMSSSRHVEESERDRHGN